MQKASDAIGLFKNEAANRAQVERSTTFCGLKLLELRNRIVRVLKQLERNARNLILVVGNPLTDPVQDHLLDIAIVGDDSTQLLYSRPVGVIGLAAFASQFLRARAVTSRLLDLAQRCLDGRVPAHLGKLLQRVLQTLKDELTRHRQRDLVGLRE